MLTFLGRSHTYCDGISRRDFIRAGTLGLGGLTLADLLRLKAQGAVDPKSAHKAVIMIFLSGGPSHIDTYDMKPDAPVDIRGEFKPIKTNVPGVEFCELMPMQAKMADKLAILREAGCRPSATTPATSFSAASPGSKANVIVSPIRSGPPSALSSVGCAPASR